MSRSIFFKILIAPLFFLLSNQVSAQMSGAYTIPGSFSSLSAAVNSLNLAGTSAGVTVYVQAGYSETVAVGGLTLTATGSATSPIVFIKSGAGANPQLVAFAGGAATSSNAVQDGIWSFTGSDYVTVDGFDLIDQNTSNPSTMEYGFGFFKASASNGCQHNLIQNCTITLNRINTTNGLGPSLSGSRGINLVNALFASQATSVLPTAASGGNSYNQFYGNKIENCNVGIVLMGYYNMAFNPTNIDTDNQVGGSGAVQSNTVINFGGGSANAPAYGITAFSQYELLVSNNLVNNNTGGGIDHPADLKGITVYNAYQANYSITGNTITLHSGASTNLLAAIENYGNIYAFGAGTIANNLIANCTYTGATSGIFRGIFCGDASTLTVSGNTITNNSTNAISGNYQCINNYYSQGAMLVTYSNNFIEFGNFGATATAMLVDGIVSNVGAPTATVNFLNNTFRGANYMGLNGGTSNFFGIRQAQSVNQVNISGNIFDNLSLKVNASAYLIYDYSQTKTVTINNNAIAGGFTNSATSGTTSAIYNINSVFSGSGLTTVSGNNFSNVSVAGASQFIGIYQSLGNAFALACTANTLSNITAASGKIYGYLLGNGGNGSVVNGNIIQNLSGGSEIYGMVIAGSNTNSLVLSQNTISAFSGSAASIVHGIEVTSGIDVRVLKNKIYDLTTGSSSADVAGLFQTTNTSFYATNNCIGDLRAPVAANDNAVKGISIGGGTAIFLRNNSVLLSGSSSGINFGSSAIYASTTATLTLQNNLLINRALANGSGKTVAFRRSSSSFSSYSSSSNNNVFFAGAVPGSANSIFYDGATVVADLPSYMSFAAPRDNSSYREDPVFTSTVGSNPGFLHLTLSANSVAESNGIALTDVVDDIDGDVRYGAVGYTGTGTSFDIGADEYAGAQIDALGPLITHTVLPTTCSTGNRTLTATISDASGVPLNSSVAPAIYFSKNNGPYQYSNGVLASGSATSGAWSFTIDATALGGILVNDVISYFIIAQDIAGSPNVSALPFGGLSASSVTLVTSTPTAPLVYTVTALAGTYSVGTGGNFPNLTAAASAYNASCLSGPVNFVLTDVLYSGAESFPITFSNNAFASITNSLHIYPAATNTAVITPPATTNAAVVKFTDARHIKLNGLNTGGSALQIVTTNSNTATTGVWIASDIQGCTNIEISNMDITGASTANVNSYGIISCSNAAAPSFTGAVNNDAITLAGNSISKFQHGIVAIGTTTANAGSNSNWQIVNNLLGSTGSNSLNILVLSGINLQNVDAMSVSGNTISNLYGGATYISGIKIGAGVRSSTFTANTITAMRNTTSSGVGSGAAGIDIQTGLAASDLLFTNNMIGDVKVNGGTSFTNGGCAGIRVGASVLSGGLKFYNNTVAMNYSNSIIGNSGALVSACMFFASTSTGIELINNLLFNNVQYASTTARSYAVYALTGASAFTAMNYNNLAVAGTQGVLGYLTSAAYSNLSTFQGAFGGNLNSQTISPVFVSVNDLHLIPVNNISLDNLGIPLAQVNIDIDAQNRSTTVPDIGADEFTPPNCAGVASLAINGNASYSICAGQTLTLTRSDYTLFPGISINWQSSSSAGGPYTLVPAASGTAFTTPTLSPGNYYFTVANTCSFSNQTAVSNEVTVTVSAYPTVSLSASVYTLCQGSTAILTASGASSFTWTPAATLNTNLGASVIASPGITTNYNVTGSNPGGCTGSNNTAQVTLTVFPASGSMTVSGTPLSICQGGSVSLSAVGTTSVYTVTPIAFAPVLTPTSGVGTLCSNGNPITSLSSGWLDDGDWYVVTIPFSFNFFSTNYTGCQISTNGFLTLGSTVPLTYNGYGFPLPSFSAARPSIGAVYGNLSFANTGTITAFTVGSAPYRKFVVNWMNGQYQASNTGTVTTQMILYETSNIIEVHTARNTGQYAAVEGIQNSTGSVAYVVSGRNNQTFNISNDSYRWTPLLNFSWSPTAGMSSAASPTTIVSNLQSSTVFTVSATPASGCAITNTVSVIVNPSPTLSISGGTTQICAGETLTLTAAGANTFTWTGGSQNSTYTVNPVVTTTYVVSGNSLTNTCAGEATQIVTVNPVPVISVSGPSAVCISQIATLTATGADTYSWSTTATTSTISVLSSSTGTTGYGVTGTSTLSGCTGSALSTVTVYATPTLAVTGGSLICSGKTLTLVANGADTYSWSTGAVTSSIYPAPATTTLYNVTGFSSPANCVGQAVFNVSVVPSSTLSVAGTNTFCSGQSGTLSASGGSVYSWSTGANTFSIPITPLANNVYIVTTTNTANGCVSSTPFSVSVFPLPLISISSPGASVCPGASASFTASGATTYSWLTTGITGAVLTATPSAPTVYTVSGTSLPGCVSGKTVGIGIFPAALITVAPAEKTLCLGEVATFTASGGQSYLWTPGNLAGNVFTVSPASSQSYMVTGTDNNNCTGDVSISLVIEECVGIVENVLASVVKVFPNPSTGLVHAVFTQEGLKHISIMNSAGQIIESRSTSSTQETFDLSPYASGLYFINISSGNSSIGFRIVIQ